MIRQIECVISGKVQGVLYRDFVRRKARALNLVGLVENVPNGTVHVVTSGEEEQLKKFIGDLQQGSIFSKVKDVKVSWSEVNQIFKDFRIYYSSLSDWF